MQQVDDPFADLPDRSDDDVRVPRRASAHGGEGRAERRERLPAAGAAVGSLPGLRRLGARQLPNLSDDQNQFMIMLGR